MKTQQWIKECEQEKKSKNVDDFLRERRRDQIEDIHLKAK